MIQHNPPNPVFSREPSSGGCEIWCDSKLCRLLSIDRSRLHIPFKESSTWLNFWYNVDEYGECAIPPALHGIPEGFNNLYEGAACYEKWLDVYDLWFFIARNAMVRPIEDKFAFDFSNAIVQWYTPSRTGIQYEPRHRPFVYPVGSQNNPSYLAGYDYKGIWGSKGDWMIPPADRRPVSNGYVSPGANPHYLDYVFYAGSPQDSRFFDDDNHFKYWKISDDDFVERLRGYAAFGACASYIDWSVYPAKEYPLYWKPVGDPGIYDITSPGFPERVFQNDMGSSLPVQGSAFDMFLTFFGYKYMVLTARGHRENNRWLMDYVEKGAPATFNAEVNGRLFQILPVAPKTRPTSGS